MPADVFFSTRPHARLFNAPWPRHIHFTDGPQRDCKVSIWGPAWTKTRNESKKVVDQLQWLLLLLAIFRVYLSTKVPNNLPFWLFSHSLTCSKIHFSSVFYQQYVSLACGGTPSIRPLSITPKPCSALHSLQGCWSQAERSSAKGGVTPWTSRQFITGPHRGTNSHWLLHSLPWPGYWLLHLSCLIVHFHKKKMKVVLHMHLHTNYASVGECQDQSPIRYVVWGFSARKILKYLDERVFYTFQCILTSHRSPSPCVLTVTALVAAALGLIAGWSFARCHGNDGCTSWRRQGKKKFLIVLLENTCASGGGWR